MPTMPVDPLQKQLDELLDHIKESLFEMSENFQTPEQLTYAINYLQFRLDGYRGFMEVEEDDNAMFTNEGC
jgi:hypothetical protein